MIEGAVEVDTGATTTIAAGSRRTASPVSALNPPPHPPKRPRITNGAEETTLLLPPSAGRKGKGRRRQAQSTDPAVGLVTSVPPTPAQEEPGSSYLTIEVNHKEHDSPSKESQPDGTIRCICGTHWDDGQMVQCDSCQTWQHTKCYRVEFERLTKDSALVWICIVCDNDKWSHVSLDSEWEKWAKRMQNKEEERERAAALQRRLDDESTTRGGGRGRGRGRRINPVGAAGSLPVTSTITGGAGASGQLDAKEDEEDEAESWRRAYVPIQHNLLDLDVQPLVRRFLQLYGPGSKYAENTVEGNKGWTPSMSKDKGKGKEIAEVDILTSAIPVIVSRDEYRTARSESLLTIRSLHIPPTNQPQSLLDSLLANRAASPSTSRQPQQPTDPPTLNISIPSTSNPTTTAAPNSFSYNVMFEQTRAQTTTAVQSRKQTPPPFNPRNPPKGSGTASPSGDKGRRASSPVVSRGRKPMTPAQRRDGADVNDQSMEPADIPITQPSYTAQRYTVHVNQHTPAKTLLALYPSNINTHSTYLSAPANQYFHLGTPKPHVKMLAAPLEVVLDARVVGGASRFVRSGCWPNTVLRSVITKKDKRKKVRKTITDLADDVEMTGIPVEVDEGSDLEVHFGIFTLRELEEGEEVVVAWEWDDAHRIHRLPRLVLEEAKMLTDDRPCDFTKDEIDYFTNLSKTITDAFTSCACADDSSIHTDGPYHSSIPAGTQRLCALEELASWVDRRKDESTKGKDQAITLDDDERTEPDETVKRHDWESSKAPPTVASQSTHPSLQVQHPQPVRATSHAAILNPAPTKGPITSQTMSFQSQPSSHPSLRVPNQLHSHPSISPRNVDMSAAVYPTNTPHPSLYHPPNDQVSAFKSRSHPDPDRWEHPSLSNHSNLIASRPTGPASVLSLIHAVDTLPISRPGSRPSSSGIFHPSHPAHPMASSGIGNSQNRSSVEKAKPSKVQRLWGKSPALSDLTPKETESEGDLMVRILGVSFGPLIDAKRGVRIEDAAGGGLYGVQAVKGYGRVRSGDPRGSRKRKRVDADESEDEEPNRKKRNTEAPLTAALPGFARFKSKKGLRPKQTRLISTTRMDIDSGEGFEYDFSFDMSPEAFMMERLNASGAGSKPSIASNNQQVPMQVDNRPSSPSQPSTHFDRMPQPISTQNPIPARSETPSPRPSTSSRPRSSLMNIANMLNSPPAPSFTRLAFQQRVVQVPERPPSPIDDHPSPSHHSPTPGHQVMFSDEQISPHNSAHDLPGPSATPSVESRASDASAMTAEEVFEHPVDISRNFGAQAVSRSPTPVAVSVLPSQPYVPFERSVTPERPAAPEDHEQSPPASSHHSRELSPAQSPARDRPRTPVPMILPPTLMERSWQSPSPTVEEEPDVEPRPLAHEDQESLKAESPSPVVPSKTSAATARSIVRRGRLITPPTPDSPSPTKIVEPSNNESTVGSASEEQKDDEEEEEEEEGEEEDRSGDDEDDDVSMKSDNGNAEETQSDSLSPAPSPPPIKSPVTTKIPELFNVKAAVPAQPPVEVPVEATKVEPQRVDVNGSKQDHQEILEQSRKITIIADGEAHIEPTNHAPELGHPEEQPLAISSPPAPPPVPPTPSETSVEPLASEELAPTAHVRRLTLKGYVARRKHNALASPSVQISPAAVPSMTSIANAAPSSPLAEKSTLPTATPMIEAPPPLRLKSPPPPKIVEPLSTTDSQEDVPLLDITEIQARLYKAGPGRMSQDMRLNGIEEPTPLKVEQSNPLVTPPTPPAPQRKITPEPTVPLTDQKSISRQQTPQETPNHVSDFAEPNIVPKMEAPPSPPKRQRTPTSPRRATPMSLSSPRRQPSQSRSPAWRGTSKAMEDGEIDTSRPSSPIRASSAAPTGPARGRLSPSHTGVRRWERDRYSDRSRDVPTQPRSFAGRLPNGGNSSERGSPVPPTISAAIPTGPTLLPASSSSLTAPKPAPQNGTPRPPPPRSNAPPSGPRALRGLPPTSPWDDKTSRAWDRDRERDRERDRDRDRDRERDRDLRDRDLRDRDRELDRRELDRERDRDRARDDRFGRDRDRDPRHRPAFRPRGK